MLPENTKIFEFNQYQKSDKASFVGYADLEYLIEKTDGCKNNPENSSATKLGEHIPSGFSMSTISSFKNIEHGHDVYWGKVLWIPKRACNEILKRKNEVINKRAARII